MFIKYGTYISNTVRYIHDVNNNLIGNIIDGLNNGCNSNN